MQNHLFFLTGKELTAIKERESSTKNSYSGRIFFEMVALSNNNNSK